MHEEAQCECDSQGAVSELLMAAHGCGGAGGLCRWETHEGFPGATEASGAVPEHCRENLERTSVEGSQDLDQGSGAFTPGFFQICRRKQEDVNGEFPVGGVTQQQIRD